MQAQRDLPKLFQGELVPEGTRLAGWAALVDTLDLKAPVKNPSCVSTKHVRGSRRRADRWQIFDKRYAPGKQLTDHVAFGLRHESIDLLVLKRAFAVTAPELWRAYVATTPHGVLARKVWFLYETLTGRELDIPDAPKGASVALLEPLAYFTGDSRLSKRHRVKDNLLGTAAFCPIVRKTEPLLAFRACNMAQQARETIGRTGTHVVARAASFLLLADSRASFAIEKERAPRNRIERWARAVLEAGKRPLDEAEIYRLHRILIGDNRFTQIGYRSDGVFLGQRDHFNNPLPEFIGAQPEDLPHLMRGLLICNERMRDAAVDPVIHAALIAFGFVMIHPLADGNGRLHRCLIHHVLTDRQFNPPGIIFPVSSVMLDRIDDYRAVLHGLSQPLMDFISWQPTPQGNVAVTNDTADLYRYGDYTEATEFLFSCVQHTVQHDWPREIDYLERHDLASARIMETVEMPDTLAHDLIRFIRQNNGVLPKKRRQDEFAALTDAEVRALQTIVADAFAGFLQA